MKKIILLTILFFFALNSYSFSYDINGNNIIWSPISDLKFVYSVYGKASGKQIWKEYDLAKKRSETIFHGNSLIPQWSYDGKNIAFTKRNILLMRSANKFKEYNTSVEDLLSIDWSLKGDKIIYSDGEKIYILEIRNNNNSFIIKGATPFFIGNDKKIIYFDENLRVNIFDESLRPKTILTNIVNKIYPLKNQNKFLFQIEKAIKLYDLNSDIIYTLVEDKNDISSFNLSYDFEFLTYNNNAGEHYIVHISTMRKVRITVDKNIFAQKLSESNKYCAFEKTGQIHIKDISSFIGAFELKNVYKISFGMLDDISMGASLEIYQEKRDPFKNTLIGYESNNFKGVVKTIAVYEDYSYGMLDKEFSSNKPIEVGDAVVWKEKNKLGIVLKK